MKKHNTVSESAESQGSLAEGRTQRERNTAREGGTQPGREGHRQRERVLRKH